MSKRSRLPWIIIGGIIIVVIIVAAVFLLNPSSKPVKIPVPSLTVPPTASVAPPTPQQAPLCIIAINGQKVPPSSIHLAVMADTCSAGEIEELRVSVNGAQKGMLGTSPGASGIFTGASGTNSVTVVAKFANGAEKDVFQSVVV
jgi:hypothetical protein